jgi:hypothetical protein
MFARRNIKAPFTERAASQVRRIASPPPEHQRGNQALLRQLQAKLSIGAVNDPLEHEADAAADRVMRMPEPKSGGCGCGACKGASSGLSAAPGMVQRKGASGGPCRSAPEEQSAPPQAPGAQSPQPEQKTAMAKRAAGTAQAAAIAAPQQGGGSPLPAAARAFMDARFGQDFSGVRIHSGHAADTMNRALGAEAFTLGADIYFRDGRYQPATEAGNRLLAHELAHVVQQRQGKAHGKVQRFTLSGFPATEAAQMNTAIPVASSTMRSCDGPWLNESIASKVDSATYEYVADSDLCGYTYPAPWANIRIGPKAFSMASCCKLESTIAHEASHTRGFVESRARALEKTCFSC